MSSKRRLALAFLAFVAWGGLSGLAHASAAAVATTAAAGEPDSCGSGEAPSPQDLSKVQLIASLALELNRSALQGTPEARPVPNSSSSGSTTDSPSAHPPVLTPNAKSRGTLSSHDYVTVFCICILPYIVVVARVSGRLALLGTAALLWLAFDRLQPWLPQTSPPSAATTASMAASGSGAVAAAAGLSPAATAASAQGGIGGDPSTRYWQHALLFMELFMGSALDALLMMALMLLSVIIFNRWRAGKQLLAGVPGLNTAGSAGSPGAFGEAHGPSTAAAGEPAGDGGAPDEGFLPQAARAARSSIEGFSAQLHSAGDRAARLSTAMRKLGSGARRRRTSADSAASSTSGTSTPNAATASSTRSSAASSSTGSMVSPEQSVLQPTTPPLLYAPLPDGPLGAPAVAASGMRLARPLQASPTSDQVNAARDAAARAAGTPRRMLPTPPATISSPDTPATPSDSASAPAAVAVPIRSIVDSSSSDDVSTAAGGAPRRERPGDSSEQQSHRAAPSGARTDSGSSAGGGASLNLGAIGHIRTVATQGPMQPMYPTRALYNSPLETVVISCKLASSSSTTQTGVGTAAYAGPSTAAPAATSPPQGAAGITATGWRSPVAPAGRVNVPLSPVQASLAAGGQHGSGVAAQRELRAVVEAAARQAVAASNVTVLSTTVTSFPGCVHVVATANLTAAAPEEAAAAEAGTEETTAVQPQTDKVAWEEVVQQILAASMGGSGSSSMDSEGVSGLLAREGLYLKHLLVQDTAGNIKYLWMCPDPAGTDASPAGAAVTNSSVRSGSVVSEPGSPTASTSSRTSSSGREGIQHGIISCPMAAAAGVSMSSFALPTDGDESAAAVAASKLLLPHGLADALAAAGAGLRIVISGSPQGAAATAAADSASGPAAATNPRIDPFTASSSRAASSEDLYALGSSICQDASYQHLLADHTLWPGTSSWPAGAELDLLQLLPGDMSDLALRFGPVLTISLVASSAGQPDSEIAGADADSLALAAGRSSSYASATEDPTAAAGSTAADIVHAILAAGVPDASAAQDPDQDQQQQPAVRSASDKLHQEIAQLVSRLNAASASEVQPSSSPPGDLPASSNAAAPSAAPDAGAAGTTAAAAAATEGDAGQQQGAVGEHLLLQLPVLLLPAAACDELVQLQGRMAAELDGEAATATAARMHVLPLIHDVAAMLNMGQHRAPAASATAFAAPELQEGHSAQQQEQQQVLSTEQKHLLKQLLQYLSDQSLDTLAATVTSHLDVYDVRPLPHQHQQQREPSGADVFAAVPHHGYEAAGVQEITATDDGLKAPSRAASILSRVASLAPSFASAQAPTAAGSMPAPADVSSAHDAHSHAVHTKQASKALQQAEAAHQQASAAQRAAAATESALQLALQQISALSAAAAEASRQAADAQAAAAAATHRAAAVEEQAERQRALQLIASPAGAPAGGPRGVGIWGLLGGNARAVAAARAAGTALLGGVMRAAEPPLVPAEVAPRDVLLGFEDERLEVQYRRLKALQCRGIDRAAFAMQLFRQVVYVRRIARLMYVSAGTGLSLVLLCKYEAVVLLPYLMMMLTPDFYIYHRHLLLCLSQIAAALTVGMIATTEVYRSEWSNLMQRPGPTLLARPSMMLLWYYLLVPVLQQQTLPEQALSCLAQLAHSLLIYLFILKGTTSLFLVVPLLLGASGLSFSVAYVADAWTRRQAVAGARRSLTRRSD